MILNSYTVNPKCFKYKVSFVQFELLGEGKYCNSDARTALAVGTLESLERKKNVHRKPFSIVCCGTPPPFSLFPLSAQLKLPAEKGKRVWILLHMCNNFFRTLKYQKYPENRVSLKKSQRRGPPGVCATRKIGESDTL